MYLISLYFDDAANERIQSYMNQIAKRTGNDAMHAGKVPPHITLSAFETTQESEAVAVLKIWQRNLSAVRSCGVR